MDFYENEKVALYLNNLNLIEDSSSSVQNVQLYKHDQLGKVLIIDDEIQHVENWIPYYHEAITHIPSMFIEKIEKILILGGGDLYAASEILKYNSVKKIVLCDHDINVINLTERYYTHAKNVLSDKRFCLVVSDAIKYINECSEKFDLIIDDCFNLVDAFKNEKIFNTLKSMLSSNGVCCSLVYRHIYDKNIMCKTAERLFRNHKTVISLVTVPEYPGIFHILSMWGNSVYLNQNMETSKNKEHVDSFNLKCELFNSNYCKYYLHIPKYLESVLKDI